MKKIVLALASIVCLVFLSGCGVSSEDWEGTGTVKAKNFIAAHSAPYRIGKISTTRQYPDCWIVAILDDKHKEKLRPRFQSSEKSDNMVRSKYTFWPCIPKEDWDRLEVNDRYTIKKETHGQLAF